MFALKSVEHEEAYTLFISCLKHRSFSSASHLAAIFSSDLTFIKKYGYEVLSLLPKLDLPEQQNHFKIITKKMKKDCGSII